MLGVNAPNVLVNPSPHVMVVTVPGQTVNVVFMVAGVVGVAGTISVQEQNVLLENVTVLKSVELFTKLALTKRTHALGGGGGGTRRTRNQFTIKIIIEF